MPAVTEQFIAQFLVQGYSAFSSTMLGADAQMGGLGKAALGAGQIITSTLGYALGVFLVQAAGTALRAIREVTDAIKDFIVESFDMAVKFESNLALLELSASGTTLTFEQLRDVSLKIGGDMTLMGTTATEASEGLKLMFLAGLTSAEVFGDLNGYMKGTAELGGAMRAAVDLTAASELDMATASDVLVISLASYGSEMLTAAERAKFMNDAANNYVQTANASVSEVEGLTQAMKMVAPTAGAIKYSINDVNTALALLSSRGLQGTIAGTSLNSMLVSLRSPTEWAQEALDDLKISVRDATTGEMLPARQIVKNFQTAFEGLTAAEKDFAMSEIFTMRGMRAMDTLVKEGTIGWDEMEVAISEAATIQETAARRADTYAGKLQALNRIIENVKIGIGTSFMPAAEEMVGWFVDMIGDYGPALIKAFEGVGKVLAAFAGYLRFVYEEGDLLNDFLVDLPAWLQPVAKLLGGVVILLQDLFAGKVGVDYPWEDIFPPWLADTIYKIIGAAMYFRDEIWPVIQTIAAWIGENIKLSDGLMAVGIVMGVVILTFLGPFLLAVGKILLAMALLTGLIALVRTAWEEDFLGIRTLVLTTLADVKQWWTDHGEEIKAWALTTYATVSENISLGLEAAKIIINQAILDIKGVWDRHGGELELWATTTYATMSENAAAGLELTKTAISEAITVIEQWWTDHKDEIIAITDAAWQGVLDVFEFYIDQFTKAAAAATLAFEGEWYKFGEKLREIWDAAWLAISTIFETAWALITTRFAEADWEYIGLEVVKGIARGILQGGSFLQNAIDAVIRAALSTFSGFFGLPDMGSPKGGWGRLPGVVQPPAQGGDKGEMDRPPTGGEKPTTPPGGGDKPATPWVPPSGTDIANNPPGGNRYLAEGTDYAVGGLNWVGEDGPELLQIPSGSQVFSLRESLELVRSAANMANGLAEAGVTVDMLSDFLSTSMMGQFQAAMPMLSSQMGTNNQETNYNTSNYYQLTAQSLIGPETLAIEFETMAMMGMIAS